jgi:hypothetical protein
MGPHDIVELRGTLVRKERARQELSAVLLQATRTADEPALAWLREKCFEVDSANFIYRLCPFDKVEQMDRNKWVTLGRWRQQHEPVVDSMHLGEGEWCPGGPERSATVSIRCGATEAVLSARYDC